MHGVASGHAVIPHRSCTNILALNVKIFDRGRVCVASPPRGPSSLRSPQRGLSLLSPLSSLLSRLSSLLSPVVPFCLCLVHSFARSCFPPPPPSSPLLLAAHVSHSHASGWHCCLYSIQRLVFGDAGADDVGVGERESERVCERVRERVRESV